MLITLLASIAAAAPTSMAYQGRLLDAAGGAITGPHELTVSLYEDSSTSSVGWSETLPVTFDEGYFHVVLGGQGSLDTEDLLAYRFLGVSIDGAPDLSRQAVTPVPFSAHAERAVEAELAEQSASSDHALTADEAAFASSADSALVADFAPEAGHAETADQAGTASFAEQAASASMADAAAFADQAATALTADTATSVNGGAASVSELRVAGALIVNSSGGLVAPVPWSGLTGVPSGFTDGVDNDSFASVSCSTGQMPQRTASGWGCVNASSFATSSSVSSAVAGHAGNASAHHTRFTAAEAREAVSVPSAGSDACPSGWLAYGDLCFYDSRRAANDGTINSHYCHSQLGGHLCTSMEVVAIRGWRGWFGGNFWYADQYGDDGMLFHNTNSTSYWYNQDGQAALSDHRHAYCCRSR